MSTYLNRPAEKILFEETIQIERKEFTVTRKINHVGELIRITELVNGRRDAVVLPADGLPELIDLFKRAEAKG